jgi:hypothetical protein
VWFFNNVYAKSKLSEVYPHGAHEFVWLVAVAVAVATILLPLSPPPLLPLPRRTFSWWTSS